MANLRLKNWFFTLVGDTQVAGFYKRFVGGGVSKPTQTTFEDLLHSTTFKTENTDKAQEDAFNAAHNANVPKQGLVTLARNVDAVDETLVYTSNQSVVPKITQLPHAKDGDNVSLTSDFGDGVYTGPGISVTKDSAVTTRREYKFSLASGLVLWLNGIKDYIDAQISGVGGEVNNGENLAGTGEVIYAGMNGTDLTFKRLKNGNGITLNASANEIEIISSSSSSVINGDVIFNGTINTVCLRSGINQYNETGIELKLIIFKQKELYKFMISLTQVDTLSGTWATYQTNTDDMLYFKMTDYITTDIAGITLLHSDTAVIIDDEFANIVDYKKAQLFYVTTGSKDLILAFNQTVTYGLVQGTLRDVRSTAGLTNLTLNTAMHTNSMFTINAIIYENTVGAISSLIVTDDTGGNAEITYIAAGTYDVVYFEYTTDNFFNLDTITTVVLTTNPDIVITGVGFFKVRARLYNNLYNTFSPYTYGSDINIT